MDLEPHYVPRPIAALIQRAGRVNRIRQEIGELETLRESVASDEPTVVVIRDGFGAGKTALVALAALAVHQETWWRNPQYDVLRAGSVVPTTNWITSTGLTLADGTAPTLATLMAAIQAPRTPRTPTELISSYRPVHEWLRLDGFGLSDLPVTVEDLVQGSDAWMCVHPPKRLAEFFEPQPVTLFVYLDRLQQLREGLLQLIDGILIALRLALSLVLAACIHCPNVRSFTLALVATFRHYGHRGEPDDHALPAYRWMSVIGGEPALSC